MIVARTRLASKLHHRRWHPYSTETNKRKHEVGIGGVKIRYPQDKTLVRLQKLSFGPPRIHSGEFEATESSAIQVDKLPSNRLTTKEIKATDSATLVDLPESISQVIHLQEEPAISSKSSGECDDRCIRRDNVTTPCLLLQKSTVPSTGKSADISTCLLLMQQLGVMSQSEISTVNALEFQRVTATSSAEPLGQKPGMTPGSAAMPSILPVVPQLYIIDADALPNPNSLPSSLGLPARLETLSSEQKIRNGGHPDTQPQDANVPASEILKFTTPSSDDLPMQRRDVPDETSRSAATPSSDMQRQNDSVSSTQSSDGNTNDTDPACSSVHRPLATLDLQDLPVLPAPSVTSKFFSSLTGQNSNADSVSVVSFANNPGSINLQQMLESQRVAVIQPEDISEASDVPYQANILQTVQVAEVSRSVDVPQAADPFQPVNVPHPARALQPVDIRQGTEMPQYMDVDVDAGMLNSSDFDGYASDSDDDQLRSGQILKSATYRLLKSQPVS